MEKINVAELLKDCPTGMELDCLMYNNLYFKCIREHAIYPIVCYTIDSKGEKEEITFNWYGKYALIDTAKCVIFPKGQTTWEGFHRPFKDGDVLYIRSGSTWICIYKESGEIANVYYKHVATNFSKLVYDDIPLCHREYVKEIRFATEEEKRKLFNTIKANGYRWNAETKTLETLIQPKFKVGDWVTDGISKCQIHFIDDTQYWYSENCILGSIESVNKQYHLWTINDAKDGDVLFHSDSASNGIFIFKEILQRGTLQKVICYCDYDSEDKFCLGENHTCCWADSKILRPATEERRNLLFQKMKEAGYKWNAETKTLEKLPKYKVGDEITNGKASITIGYIDDEYYYEVGRNITTRLLIKNQDEWKLVPNKFNITTLKPFNKVLVRSRTLEKWRIQFFEKYDKTYPYPFICLGGINYKQCIPYECNEHLLDTANDCQEFYKNWE